LLLSAGADPQQSIYLPQAHAALSSKPATPLLLSIDGTDGLTQPLH